MTLKHIYLMLCVIGAVLPLSQFIPWVMEHGLNIPLFFNQLFANPISRFFGLDVMVSAVVLMVFIVTDGKRRRIKALWLPLVATLTIGVSCGLPLFLYQRQSQREHAD